MTTSITRACALACLASFATTTVADVIRAGHGSPIGVDAPAANSVPGQVILSNMPMLRTPDFDAVAEMFGHVIPTIEPQTERASNAGGTIPRVGWFAIAEAADPLADHGVAWNDDSIPVQPRASEKRGDDEAADGPFALTPEPGVLVFLAVAVTAQLLRRRSHGMRISLAA